MSEVYYVNVHSVHRKNDTRATKSHWAVEAYTSFWTKEKGREAGFWDIEKEISN